VRLTSGGPHSRTARIGAGLCLAGAALGAVGLLDALAGTGLLRSNSPRQVAMTGNSALVVLLLGVGAVLRAREHARATVRALATVAAVVALAIGIGTIAEYALAVDLGLDQLIGAAHRKGPHPGRPAPSAAASFALVAGALLALDVRRAVRSHLSEWLLLPVALATLTALLAVVFGAELQAGPSRVPIIGMALPTAAGLFLISIGLLFERPSRGFMSVATSTGPGGRQLRRFALPMVLVPILLALVVTLLVMDAGIQAVQLVVAVLASSMVIVGLLLLAMTGVSLNRGHEAVAASQAWAHSLVDEAPDAVFVANVDGRYIDVNSAGCRMFGYTREEILDRSIVDLIRPEDVERLAEDRERHLRGETFVSEWQMRRKDGTFITAEISAKIFPDGRWQAMVRDVTERKRLEQDLRTAQAEQTLLAELGSALVGTIGDRETVEIFARFLVRDLADGCSIETLEEDGELHARVVIHRDPTKAAVCRRLETMKLPHSGGHLAAKVQSRKQPILIREVTPADLDALAQSSEHRRALDELAPTSVLAMPLLAHGGVVGSLVLIRSVPGRPYAPSDLRFAGQVATRAALAIEKSRLYRVAQEAIRLRDDVLNVVAHDLRNPLGTILLQAGLLRRHLERDRRATKPADVIQRSATRMNHLIQDLLDVARMEGGRLSIAQSRVSAQHVLAEAIAAHEALVASADLELRLDGADDLPDLWADHERLLQVFENLIGNAIKFTAAGGRITVGAEPLDDQVHFWVADTGIGLAEHEVPHVFERLWQASATGRRGAGLGLPIVKGLVEAHGGRVWVESTPGEGSTFHFSIPTAGPPESWRARPEAHVPSAP
jgi:PAS domain S-box-containing protein